MVNSKKFFNKSKRLVFSLSTITTLSTLGIGTIHNDTHSLKSSIYAPHIIRIPTTTANDQDGLKTPSECLKESGVRCYSPREFNVAYGFNNLFKSNITGKGSTIVIVDAGNYGDIQKDLNTFDKATGLPDTTVEVKQFDHPSFDADWAIEEALDVEYAHAVAPDAKIVLAETNVNDDIQGIINAENSLINTDQNFDVITQSFSWDESINVKFPQYYKEIHSLYHLARSKGITVLAASGDYGSYEQSSPSYPATDADVTSIGGTLMTLDDNGKRLTDDSAWDGSGGGISSTIAAPKYQRSVYDITGGIHRAGPDISMSASTDGACQIYQSVVSGQSNWILVGGTSEASPMFAGVIALADQKIGHSIGFINKYLYDINTEDKTGLNTGVEDVTTGSNGNPAKKYYDLVTGIGTVGDATTFINTLVGSIKQ